MRSVVMPMEDEMLFRSYMKLVDVPKLEFDETANPMLYGKKLGLINGSAWIGLWGYYFGRKHLPGVKLINVGNEAVQLNFMRAHERGEPCPPPQNIDLFARYAKDLIELAGVDAILITCSTMNRSFRFVQESVKSSGVPVVSIDQPMMEEAVRRGGTVLVIATHGPTVRNTQLLLEETAAGMGKLGQLAYVGATVEDAFYLLGQGEIHHHNERIAETIRSVRDKEPIETVVLAQLSMSVFGISYPDPVCTLGVHVLTSGDEGFKRIRQLWTNGEGGS